MVSGSAEALSAGNAKYLLIVGAQKAATTSLFAYLAAHPFVAPCRVKEPHYFLPPDYPVRDVVRHGRDDFRDYDQLFPVGAGLTRLDGSATYLHGPGCAERIRRVLPDAKIVIAIRNPLDRLISWYSMAKLRGWIEPQVSLPDYVALLKEAEGVDGVPHHLRALEHGLYAGRISEYRSHFGEANVSVVVFDDLKREPANVVQQICIFAGLDPRDYSEHEFGQHLPARSYRANALGAAYRWVRPYVRRIELFREDDSVWVRRIRRWVGRWLMRSADPVSLDPASEQFLIQYYRADVEATALLIGRALPWRPFDGND